jgi:methylenetetrahydrofolate reductase (NADPH)
MDERGDATKSGMALTGSVALLLKDFSLEMTGKDIPSLKEARAVIPAGTRINVTFLGNESFQMRTSASRAVREFGFTPVPHISARRLTDRRHLEEFLNALQAEKATEHLFAVGGDPASPEGPYQDSLQVIQTGLLQEYGAKEVSIAGYPEGHPDIPNDELWLALEAKCLALHDQGLQGVIITQFGFDIDVVVSWVESVRARGIHLPIRVGVPGPAGVRRLLAFAARFGVASSAGIAKKYGLSLTNLMGTSGPDRFISDLGKRYDPTRHGDLKIHFYTFGGIKATSDWVARFLEAKHD